jgi:hypothetical protein
MTTTYHNELLLDRAAMLAIIGLQPAAVMSPWADLLAASGSAA